MLLNSSRAALIEAFFSSLNSSLAIFLASWNSLFSALLEEGFSFAKTGVIESNKPPTNKREYLIIEGKMKSFSSKIKINLDELDLVLWSFKTGKVLK